MKQVVAIVKPFQAEKVLEVVGSLPIDSCEVHQVKGYGRQKNYLDEYRGSEYSQAYLPKVEMIFWVEDAYVEQVLETVVSLARTGRMGDGKIFVLDAEPETS